MFTLKWKLLTQNTYRKNYGDKKGSAGNLDDLLRKCCKSRYTDLSCSDVHWNFWRMCNALRLGSEVCNWYRLFGEEGTQMFKKVCSLYSAFYPSLRFTLSLQSAFYTQSAFYPWSAVCSLQSAFYTDRFSFPPKSWGRVKTYETF